MLKRIAVMVSGGGTNLQAMIDAQNDKIIRSGYIALVISNKEDAYALKRAEKCSIKTSVITDDEVLIETLKSEKIDLIVLAGYLKILSKKVINEFENRIINIHPSLIPSFCGNGCYGLRVHELALDYGVKITGATVHFVNEITDGGKIIMQKAVEVRDNDDPKSLQKRVMEEAEWKILPEAVELVLSGLN